VTRVVVIVEGQTEETFVNDVLAEVFWPDAVYLSPVLLGVPGHKGGRPSYARVKKDVLLHLKQDKAAYCSTMLDFYGLGPGFPGTLVPMGLPSIAKAVRIEEAIKADVCRLVPDLRPDVRFLPYVQLHEYEGLLFSDPRLFAEAVGQPHLAAAFQSVRDSFPTPEDIDDDVSTAPSKRILLAFGSYRKTLDGTIAARRVGIEAMRRECPHFRDWLSRLQGLARG
jgi:hypothetical protein